MSKENILYGTVPKTALKEQTVGEYLFNILNSSPLQRTCITDLSNEKAYSNQDILQFTCQLATAFTRNGFNTNDVIAISMENTVTHLCVVLASFFSGLCTVPLNPFYTERELENLLNNTVPKVVFCTVENEEKYISLKQKLGFPERIVVIDGTTYHVRSLDEFMLQEKNLSLANTFRPVKCNWNDNVALIMPSSGTTGMPKGVMLTHKNLVVSLEMLKNRLNGGFVVLKPRDCVISFLPLFHVYGLVTVLEQIVVDLHTVLMKKFEVFQCLKTVEKYRVNGFFLVPSILSALNSCEALEKFDLSSLKEICVGSNVLKKSTLDNSVKTLKVKNIRQGYGMTECTMAMMVTPLNNCALGSVGTLLPYVMGKVIDINTKVALGPNQKGELCFKGDMIMKGYHKNEKANKKAFDNEGWLLSGDYGYYDHDGNFFIIGRLKEIIKYNGFQVSPNEIEELLLEHPKIKEAAVFGIPHSKTNEEPAAFIVLQPNVLLSENDVKTYVADNLVYYKQLRGGVKFVKEILRTSTGKYNRSDLSKLFVKNFKVE